MKVDDVWRSQRQWSVAAGRAAASLARWRAVNLGLILLGSVMGAAAAHIDWAPQVVTATMGAVGAASLALAGLVQVRFLNAPKVRERLVTRAVSEGLKGVTYQYLAGVAPFAGPGRDAELSSRVAEVERKAGDHKKLVVGLQPDDRAVPDVQGVADYVRLRAIEQRDWHEQRTVAHRRLARRWRAAELTATALAAVLAAVGGALQGVDLSSWVAVAATAAAAFAAHLASQQHDQIAESYAGTVLALDALTRELDPASADPQEAARYVEAVELVLATQNAAWTSLIAVP